MLRTFFWYQHRNQCTLPRSRLVLFLALTGIPLVKTLEVANAQDSVGAYQFKREKCLATHQNSLETGSPSHKLARHHRMSLTAHPIQSHSIPASLTATPLYGYLGLSIPRDDSPLPHRPLLPGRPLCNLFAEGGLTACCQSHRGHVGHRRPRFRMAKYSGHAKHVSNRIGAKG